MNKTIDTLYELYFKSTVYATLQWNNEKRETEWRLKNFLLNNMPNEYKRVFDEFLDIITERHEEELKKFYAQAFKNGVKLITESLED